MIYNDGNSELHIRLHIAEMLKDKVEQDNFEELCEKTLKFVMNGIELPKVKKNPVEEAADMLAKLATSGLAEIEKAKLPKKDTKENELESIAKKWDCYGLTHQDHLCYICGYSTEFNCLIAGTYEDCEYADVLGKTDVVNRDIYKHYFYIPLDDKFKS